MLVNTPSYSPLNPKPMNNPFQTPNATVELAEFEPPKPQAVVLAIRILWATMAIGLFSMLPGIRDGFWNEFSGDNMEIMIGVVVVFTVLSIAIFVALMVYLGRRANWARWGMLAMMCFGWIVTVSQGSDLIDQGMLAVVIDLGVAIAEAYAMALLFFGTGAQWFKARPEQ